MRVHKRKYKKAVEMLKQGKSYREIAKQLGLSISQISEIAKNMDIYVDLSEERRKLRREIRELKRQKAELEKEIRKEKDIIEGVKESLEELEAIEEILSGIYESILEERAKPAKSWTEKKFYESRTMEELMRRIGKFNEALAKIRIRRYMKELEKMTANHSKTSK